MSRTSASRRFSSGRWRRSERQKVEGHECGHLPAALGQERAEVALSVVLEHDRLTLDHRLVRREAANRVGDPRKAVGKVGGASAPNLDVCALLQGDDAEAVVLNFVQPAGSGGRVDDERGFAWSDEADRRAPPPTGRGTAPRYGFPQLAVMAMRVIALKM
jgi:hypothetical protein